MPLASLLALTASNAGKTTTFSPSNTLMWFLGIISSTLFYGSVFATFSLASAPFWIIYTSLKGFYAALSWSNYTSTITSYSSNIIDFLIQSYFLPFYHYSTGFTSVLIFSVFKKIALASNLAGMSNNDSY